MFSKREAFIVAAASFAVAAAGSEKFLAEDELHRNLEGRNLLDRSWPADNCCRIYEHDKFTGTDTNG